MSAHRWGKGSRVRVAAALFVLAAAGCGTGSTPGPADASSPASSEDALASPDIGSGGIASGPTIAPVGSVPGSPGGDTSFGAATPVRRRSLAAVDVPVYIAVVDPAPMEPSPTFGGWVVAETVVREVLFTDTERGVPELQPGAVTIWDYTPSPFESLGDAEEVVVLLGYFERREGGATWPSPYRVMLAATRDAAGSLTFTEPYAEYNGSLDELRKAYPSMTDTDLVVGMAAESARVAAARAAGESIPEELPLRAALTKAPTPDPEAEWWATEPLERGLQDGLAPPDYLATLQRGTLLIEVEDEAAVPGVWLATRARHSGWTSAMDLGAGSVVERIYLPPGEDIEVVLLRPDDWGGAVVVGVIHHDELRDHAAVHILVGPELRRILDDPAFVPDREITTVLATEADLAAKLAEVF